MSTKQPPLMQGKHLIVDFIVSDASVFTEENQENMLKEVVRAAGMELIFGPISKAVEPNPELLKGTEWKDSGGITSMALLASIALLGTSHCSLHSFSLTKIGSFDCYSCKDFNHSAILDVIKKYLNPVSMNVNLISRIPTINIL